MKIIFLTQIPLHSSSSVSSFGLFNQVFHSEARAVKLSILTPPCLLLILAIREIYFLVLDSLISVSFLNCSSLTLSWHSEVPFLLSVPFHSEFLSSRSLHLLFLFPGHIFSHVVALINLSYPSDLNSSITSLEQASPTSFVL